MIRAAALASGEGEKLQAILDAMAFGELPELELTAVIVPEKNAFVAQRAIGAKVPAYVVDPDLFPTMTSHSMAVANKLKDMDVDLVLLCDYDQPLGVIPYQFRNKVIGTWPTLCPAFEDCEGNVFEALLAYGCKVAGATSYIADADGRVGKIIDQRAVPVLEGDTPETLERRVMEEAAWPLMAEAVKRFCKGKTK